ncbi:MAG: ferritin family protein [Desulfobacterales bacterium]|nr:ferritin family protein [Desulfobacterales bacterium]
MTPRELFRLIARLENDLADFYQELGQVDRLKPFADIFSFMADHSQRHARRIETMEAGVDLPVLNVDPVRELHARLKTSLRAKIAGEKDEDAALSQLAHTEEVVGQLYQSMATHYRKLAGAYTDVADQLETLSREEYSHRDYILGKENN